jgi:hypothetical protein
VAFAGGKNAQNTAEQPRYGLDAGARARKGIRGDSDLKQSSVRSDVAEIWPLLAYREIEIVQRNMEIGIAIYVSYPAFSGSRIVAFYRTFRSSVVYALR